MNFLAPGDGLPRFVDELLGKPGLKVRGVHERTSDVRPGRAEYLPLPQVQCQRRMSCPTTTSTVRLWDAATGREVAVLDGPGRFARRHSGLHNSKSPSVLTSASRSDRNQGPKPVRLPPRSPNLNAHLERFWRSLREECLDRLIFFGESALCQAVTQFVLHFHSEGNHQGLGNRLIEAGAEVGRTTGDVQCRERLGGILRYYYRQVA